MSDPEFAVVTTRLGHLAVQHLASGEIMHPIGPVQEAQDLYIAPSRLGTRLAEPSEQPLVLYDCGLGAGTNAALAWKLSESRSFGRELSIVSFDTTLDALRLALLPENQESFGLDGDVADIATRVASGECCQGKRTNWRFVGGEIPQTLAEQPPADIIYWDMFSSNVDDSLWSVSTLGALRAQCAAATTLHTYSASTRVRAAMLLAGFAVGFGSETGTKSQTTIAATRLPDLAEPLGARWLERLHRSSAALPADAPQDGIARIAALPQFQEHGPAVSAPT